MRVLSKSGMIIVTPHVTWEHALNPRFPPMSTPVPDGAKSFRGGSVEENTDEQAPSAEDNVESGGESDADDGVFYDRFASSHDTTPAGVKKPARQKNPGVENPNDRPPA